MFSTKSFSIVLIISLLFHSAIYSQKASQEKDTLSLTKSSLSNQFDYAIKRSNDWHRDYKIIKTVWLTTLKSHTLDSLKVYKEDISEKQIIIDKQTQEIEALKNDLTMTQTTLETTRVEKDNINLFGLQLSKSGYSILMWSLIAILFALLLMFIFKFRNSNTITKQAKKSLTETEEEFEEHRRNSLEREQKVRRQLQDEINKHKKEK